MSDVVFAANSGKSLAMRRIFLMGDRQKCFWGPIASKPIRRCRLAGWVSSSDGTKDKKKSFERLQ